MVKEIFNKSSIKNNKVPLKSNRWKTGFIIFCFFSFCGVFAKLCQFESSVVELFIKHRLAGMGLKLQTGEILSSTVTFFKKRILSVSNALRLNCSVSNKTITD